jgi:hypothetical protein
MAVRSLEAGVEGVWTLKVAKPIVRRSQAVLIDHPRDEL